MDLATKKDVETLAESMVKMTDSLRELRDLLSNYQGKGLTRQDVADEYGLHYNTVLRHQREIGFIPGDRMSRVSRDQVRKYFLTTRGHR